MRARHASDDTKLQPQTWAEERGKNFRLPSGLRLRCVAELSSSAVRRHPSDDATDKTTRSNTKQRPPCRYLQLYHHHANVVPASSGQGELRQYDGGLLSSVFSSAVRHLPHQLSAEALPRDLADHLVGDDVPQPIAGQNQELVFLRPVELQGFVCVCIYTLWSEESGTAMSPRESTALESPQLATTIRSGPTTATDAVDPTSISSDASSPSTLEKLMAITSLHCSSALGHSPNAATSSASTTWSRSRHAHATLTPQCPSYTPKKSYSGAVPTDANLGATVTASSISLLRPISDTDPWDKQGAIPLLALWASEPKLRFRFLTRLAGQPPELASALIQRSWRRRWRIVFRSGGFEFWTGAPNQLPTLERVRGLPSGTRRILLRSDRVRGRGEEKHGSARAVTDPWRSLPGRAGVDAAPPLSMYGKGEHVAQEWTRLLALEKIERLLA
ncbi:hypothetical protein BHE74_00033438 [Ensete ventricosum]|nr:hypothetical protein BHE74_00033438 [Ensete ventricosum]